MRETSLLQSGTLNTHLIRIALLLATLPTAQVRAERSDWHNTDGGSFTFEARYQGEPIPGRFRDFTVDFRFDPDNPGDARLRVTVDLGSADMGDADMNDTLSSPAWFNTSRFTTARYLAETVEAQEEGGFVARGVLDLKGLAKPVEVPFRWRREGEGARMLGAFSLRRTEFDVGIGQWSSGDSIALEVQLEFDIPMQRER